MQLDFDLKGRPEKAPETPRVLTVTALTRRIRDLLESGVGELWVEGEISNLRRQSSGHVYFTLKDGSSQLACVLFAGQAAQLRGVDIADGLQMQAFGQVTVYEARGQYQMIVRNLQEKGRGALQAKFEELKQRLAAEGLFDAARKRKLPPFPRRVGVVTSPTGAALRDFLHVLHRRQPGIQVVIHPVRVQGRGAAAEIAGAVRDFSNGAGEVDVIVVTRGGGSMEDLWEFNEEAVARAISESKIPVVSAIGHEIDFTISDFAADVRAPTPSAAAEILSADGGEVLARLDQFSRRLFRQVQQTLQGTRHELAALRRTALFLEPARAVQNARLALDRGAEDLLSGAESGVYARRRILDRSAARLSAGHPGHRMAEMKGRLGLSLQQFEACCRRSATEARSRLTTSQAVLEALNPRAALARGYTITRDSEGALIRSAANLKAGAKLVTRFADGEVESTVDANRPIDSPRAEG